ncbi:hypothetical protein [Alicyclobacillus fodiniaquatilis]|uniref:ABC-2 type transport system permease protein n=1 Tax=Alicyclobacillus fodiniaquatilis TaxID=1661150 RepID=A0ABW4JGG0_9BACL
MNVKSAWRLGTGLFWRNVRGQRKRLLITPLLIIGILLMIPLSVLYAPGLVTPQTIPRLEQMANLSLGVHGGREALFAASLFGMGPYLIALLMSNMASSNAQGSFATEAAQGSLELLFSAPYRASEIFAGILLSSLFLTFSMCLIIAICTYGIAVGFMLGAGIAVPWSPNDIVFILLMPFALSMCSALISLFISLLFPRAVKVRTGGTNNLAQLLSMIPSFAFFILIPLRPGLNLTDMSMIALLVGLIGSLVIVWFFGRWFRPELVLEK